MSADELAILVAALSVLIAQDQTVETIELWSAILDQVSVTLATIAVRRAAEQQKSETAGTAVIS